MFLLTWQFVLFWWWQHYNRSVWLNVGLAHLSGLVKDLKYSKSNWLLNSQLREPIMGSCQSQGGGSWILVLFLKEMKACIVPVLVALFFLRIAQNISCFLVWPKNIVFAAQERLSLLVLIHIHYLTYIDLKEVFTENWKDLFQPQSVNSALQAKVWFSPSRSHLSTI